ncbi:MAG: UDP-glucose/GDP-mannose dehydrogenase family protein [Elusimicrobia bacterium]|nr:UDP-glucose/GDP-mannose dehydrogenase family protein [Elusimicrobiota bacterium]
MKKHNICVIGTGYVGLVTGTCLAELGNWVVCVDSDSKKIALLKSGKLPIYEPGLDKLVHKNTKAGRLHFSGSISEGIQFKGRPAEIIFIAVGTPPRQDGSADLSNIESVAEQIAKNIKTYTLIVEKSTVPVETGEWISRTIERANTQKIPFDVASNPEFLREGSAVHDFLHPDRVVLGVSSKQAEAWLKDIYSPLKSPILVTDIKSAELIKHASNSFLAAKISFINAVANVCEKVGADVVQIARGMGMDKRIGPSFLSAGIGYGGFCFPKDLEAFYWISHKKGYDFKLLKVVKDINEEQKNWILKQVEAELWNLEGKRIGVLGLAFKPNTDDLRFAPSLEIIQQLLERKTQVHVYDPVAMPKAKTVSGYQGVRFCKDAYECAREADALVLVTEWPEFAKLDFKKIRTIMHRPLLIDGRNLYDPKKLRDLGFTYKSVGRP